MAGFEVITEGWDLFPSVVLSKLPGRENSSRNQQDSFTSFVHLRRVSLSLYIRYVEYNKEAICRQLENQPSRRDRAGVHP
jgi:hypothetical protein